MKGVPPMTMILWAYAGLTGAIVFCLLAVALMIGMPVGGALSISATTAAWMVAIPAIIVFMVRELRAGR